MPSCVSGFGAGRLTAASGLELRRRRNSWLWRDPSSQGVRRYESSSVVVEVASSSTTSAAAISAAVAQSL